MNLTSPAHHSPRIEALFPPGVIAAEVSGPVPLGLLYPAEAAGLGRMVASRAAEFAGGRLAARLALERLGVEGFAVTAAPDRKPVWPEGVVGSITHSAGLCAAVAARHGECLGLGLDTEQVGRVTAPLAARICVPSELAWIESLEEAQRPAGRALVFAAKEAFYKAQSPLTDEWLGFEALAVEVPDFAAGLAQGGVGRILATPTRAIALDALADRPWWGRFRFYDGFVTAGLSLSKPDRRGTP